MASIVSRTGETDERGRRFAHSARKPGRAGRGAGVAVRAVYDRLSHLEIDERLSILRSFATLLTDLGVVIKLRENVAVMGDNVAMTTNDTGVSFAGSRSLRASLGPAPRCQLHRLFVRGGVRTPVRNLLTTPARASLVGERQRLTLRPRPSRRGSFSIFRTAAVGAVGGTWPGDLPLYLPPGRPK
jgi:hypothetical protein